MQKNGSRSTLESASTVAVPVFNTIVFLLVASYLGVGPLGALAILLSLTAVLTLSFDISLAWRSQGGREARFALHALSLATGVVVAFFGYATQLDWRIVPLGLYMAYHGASSAAIALLPEGDRSATCQLIDAAGRFGLVWAVLALEMAEGTQTMLALAFLMGGLLGLAAASPELKRLRLRQWRAQLREATGAPLAYALAGSLLLWVDKPLLWFLSDTETVGYYFAVQRVVVFIGSAAVVITSMVARELERLPDEHSLRLVTLMERYAWMFVLPMTAFYLVFARPMVVVFFGSDFGAHSDLVYPLVLGNLAAAMASPSMAWLASRRRFGPLLGSAALSLTSLVVVALALDRGASGWAGEPEMAMALGCLTSGVALFLSVRLFVWKASVAFHEHLPHHIVSAMVMAVVLYWIGTLFEKHGFFELVLLALLGVLVYGVALYLFGEFMRGEYYEFKELRGL
jgi:O-antigen/teichoic acid export membrane protein